MNYNEMCKMLNAEIRAERVRHGSNYNKKVIRISRSWNINSEGSRECASVSMERIYEAYAEYRSCEVW